MFGVREFERVKSEAELGVGGSPMVEEKNDEGEVVGQEYLPILLALGKTEPVVGQKQVVVDHVVSDSQLEVCQDCLLTTRLIVSGH